MSRIMEFVGQYLEPMLLGAVAIGAVAGAGALIVDDLRHAPNRTYTAFAAAVPAPASTPAADTSVTRVEAAAETRGDLSNLTLFARVPFDFGDGRSFDVVTGLVYANSWAEKPSREFCYLQAGNLSAAARVTLSLAAKEHGAAGSVEPAKLADADASAVGLPLKRIQESVASCRFI